MSDQACWQCGSDATVTGCHIGADGNLNVEFGPQLAISVEPDDEYESWDVEQDKFKVVAGAGGIWRRNK